QQTAPFRPLLRTIWRWASPGNKPIDLVLAGARHGSSRLLAVAASAGRLLARNPDGSSRLHGKAPGHPVSRPPLDIPVSARRAAGALASPEFLLVAACCRWPPSQARNA